MDFSKENVDYKVLIPKLHISSRHPQRTICCPVEPTDHYVGADLSSLMTDIYGDHPLPDEKIVVHFRGTAGDAFGANLCSGVTFVIDGVGKNSCHNMSGGKVVLLSVPKGDFAVGMSGGTVYLPANPDFKKRGQALQEEDTRMLHDLLDEHLQFTQSKAARDILASWPKSAECFVKIVGK